MPSSCRESAVPRLPPPVPFPWLFVNQPARAATRVALHLRRLLPDGVSSFHLCLYVVNLPMEISEYISPSGCLLARN